MAYAIARDGAELFYKDWGEGRPVVLLHGWPLTADTFDDMAIALAERGFRAIVPDRRGFGRSEQTWTGNDYDTYTDDVAAILDEAEIDGPVALVGFSMGGGEVARFQTKYPGRTSAAVLISSVVPYMLQTDDNPNGVPQSTFDEMTAGMKKDRAHFFTGFFKDFYGVGALSSPVSDEVLMNSWRQTMMAGTKNTLDAAKAFATTDFRPDLANFRSPYNAHVVESVQCDQSAVLSGGNRDHTGQRSVIHIRSGGATHHVGHDDFVRHIACARNQEDG